MPQAEWIALAELLGMLLLGPRTGVLIALLVLAAALDVRSHRIPNWLVFGGAVYGILSMSLFPAMPSDTWIESLKGLGLGLGLLLPFYLLRTMGAGDVKLMAMAGAFLGPMHTVYAVLATLLAGGLLAISVALASGALRRTLHNLYLMTFGAALQIASGTKPDLSVAASSSTIKLPYGVAIATGTTGYLVARLFGFFS